MNRTIEISVHASFLFYLAVMLLLLPVEWLLGSILAAAVHECAHLLAIRLMGIKANKIEISAGGAKIETAPMYPHQELLSAAAGPIGSLVLLAVFPVFPQAAVCALAHTIFNLLPLFPFDGGRILRTALEILSCKHVSDKVCQITENLVRIILIVLALCLFRFGIFLPIIFFVLIIKSTRNYPVRRRNSST